MVVQAGQRGRVRRRRTGAHSPALPCSQFTQQSTPGPPRSTWSSVGNLTVSPALCGHCRASPYILRPQGPAREGACWPQDSGEQEDECSSPRRQAKAKGVFSCGHYRILPKGSTLFGAWRATPTGGQVSRLTMCCPGAPRALYSAERTWGLLVW